MGPKAKIINAPIIDLRKKNAYIKPTNVQKIILENSSIFDHVGLLNKIPILRREKTKQKMVRPFSRGVFANKSKQRNMFEQNK